MPPRRDRPPEEPPREEQRAAEETEIVAALRQGAEAAFEAVYAAHKQRIYGFLLRLSGDPHATADLFQNVWLKLARYSHLLKADTNLSAWLHTVARNEYTSYRRAQLIDASRLLTLGRHVERTALSDAPAETRDIESALERLSDSDREVLLLSAASGLDSTEAAHAVGISAQAWRQRLARARHRLARQLERLEHDAVRDRPVLTQGVRS